MSTRYFGSVPRGSGSRRFPVVLQAAIAICDGKSDAGSPFGIWESGKVGSAAREAIDYPAGGGAIILAQQVPHELRVMAHAKAACSFLSVTINDQTDGQDLEFLNFF